MAMMAAPRTGRPDSSVTRSETVWVEAHACRDLANEGRYRAKRATVTGVLHYSEEGFFVAPMVVHSILREAAVAWGR